MKSDNIPSHNHDINISATGSTDVGGASGTFPSNDGYDSNNYMVAYTGAFKNLRDNQKGGWADGGGGAEWATCKYNGNHTHKINLKITGRVNLYGKGVPCEVITPYIGVYMWERIG